MDTLIQYFTDPELNSDSLRQSRAILCFCEARQGVPLNVYEISKLNELLQTIILNLERNYTVDENTEKQVFDQLLSHYAKNVKKLQTISDLPIQKSENDKPNLLVPALIDMLSMLIGKGVFYEKQADQIEALQLSDLFNTLSNLFFQVLPTVLLQFSEQEYNEAFYKGVIDILAILSMCGKIGDELCQITGQQDSYQPIDQSLAIQSRVSSQVVAQCMGQFVIPNLAKLLKQCNQQQFSHLLPHQNSFAVPKQYLDDLQLAILYFIDQLLQKHITNVNDILNSVIDFIASPVNSRQLTLCLSILQQIDTKNVQVDLSKLAKLLSNAFFTSGGLKVDCVNTAETQLALLSIANAFSKNQPVFIAHICEDNECQIQENLKEHIYGLKKTAISKRNATTTIQNGRIVDLEEKKPKKQELTQTTKQSDQSDKKENLVFNDSDDEEEARADAMRRTRILEQAQIRKDKYSVDVEQALQQSEPRPRAANFVKDFLIQIFKNYGQNIFHSSRSLQKFLMDVKKDQSALRKNVLEGHSVNYIELNKTRVSNISNKMTDFKVQQEQQIVKDEVAMETIRKKGMCMKTLNEKVALEEIINNREKQQTFLLKQNLLKDKTFSHNVQSENNIDYQKTLFTKKEHQIQTIDTKFELYFIAYALRILENIFVSSRTSPSRQIRFVLQEIDADFVNGVVQFVDKCAELTEPSLALIHAILVYPQKLSQSAAEDQWTLFFQNGLLDFLNNVNKQKQIYGAVFIIKIFTGEWQELVPVERLCQLAELLIESFIELFYQVYSQQNQLLKTVFTAIALLSCAYGLKVGSLALKIDLTLFKSFLTQIINIFDNPKHDQLYTASIVIYGLFGLPRQEAASRLCYDTGIFKSVLQLIIKIHGEETKDIRKITAADVVLIRTLSDIIQVADIQIQKYTQTRADLQNALCNCYRQWQKSCQIIAFNEETGVILPSIEVIKKQQVIARGDIFESRGAEGYRAVSPTVERDLQKQKRNVLSPTRSRVNANLVQTAILKGDFDVPLNQGTFQDIQSIPEPYLKIASETRYLLKFNFTATALGFFRALYPDLAHHDCAPSCADKSALPKTARLEQKRPPSGQTPNIGMKIPMILPSLSQAPEKVKNQVDMFMEQRDLLCVMQMVAAGPKESLIQLNMAQDADIVRDDLEFVKDAISYLEDRLRVMERAGTTVADDLRRKRVTSEARFYSYQKAE